jgi:hypothetical protein
MEFLPMNIRDRQRESSPKVFGEVVEIGEVSFAVCLTSEI